MIVLAQLGKEAHLMNAVGLNPHLDMLFLTYLLCKHELSQSYHQQLAAFDVITSFCNVQTSYNQQLRNKCDLL